MNYADPINNAREYARNKYISACDEISGQSHESLIAARAQLAARGLANSGLMEKAVGDNRADLLKALIQARVDALIDGLELYGVPITEELAVFIVNEATKLREEFVSNSIKTSSAEALRQGTISASIVRGVLVPVASIRCQIEERRVKPKMTPQPPSVTNVYHVSGHNSRVNVQSTDQSVNVVVTNEELFQKIRETIYSAVPAERQPEILERLQVLEQAQGSTIFGQRYTEFVAAAADYMTLIGPFIPALSELLRKIL